MASERSIRRYRYWYAKLLLLYSRRYRDRFGASMQQTFNDLCRERAAAGGGILAFVAWMFIEALIAGATERLGLMIAENRRFAAMCAAIAVLLLVPLVAMQFSEDVVWTWFDFVFAGVFLFGSALILEIALRRVPGMTYRLAAAMAIGTTLFLVWANGAVGIIGSEDNDWNAMYLAVLGVAVLGSLVARFRPPGIALAMFAAAAMQALVTAIALAAGQHNAPEASVAEIVLVNGFFVSLWVVTGAVFREAAGGGRRQARIA